MEAPLAALEDRLRQTEEVLVAERLAKPPPFSGDVDSNGQPEGMPWSQWSFIFRSYNGAFDPGATRLLQQVETKVEDPAMVDNTTTPGGERRLSVQLFYVLALSCRGKPLQVVRRVPEGFGFEAWKQLCKEFESRFLSRFQGILQAILSPTTTDDPVQTIHQWESRSWHRNTCPTESLLAT